MVRGKEEEGTGRKITVDTALDASLTINYFNPQITVC